MKRAASIAWYEFYSNVSKPSFLLTVFGLPLFIFVVYAIIFFVSFTSAESGEVNAERIGVVDMAGVLTAEASADYVPYANSASAQEALGAGDVDMFFVIPADYLARGVVETYAYGTLPEPVKDDMEAALRASLIANLDSDLPQARLENPLNMAIRFENTGRTVNGPAGLAGLFIVPFAFVFIFMMAMQFASGYLMSSIVEEKSNRLMEILLTTLRPLELLAGKLLGLGAVGMVQLLAWAGMALLAMNVFGNTEVLSGIDIPADLLVVGLVYFILSYFLYGSILSAIGALSDTDQESRQYAGVVSLLVVVPLFAIAAFLEDPNGGLPVLLSMIPFTSGMAMLMRLLLGIVPFAEVALSLALTLGTTLLSVWVSARVFRWALLLYGKKPNLRQLWAVISGQQRDMGVLTPEKKGA